MASPIDHAFAILKHDEPCPSCGSTKPKGWLIDGEWMEIPEEWNPEKLCGPCYDEMDKKWRALEKPSDFRWSRDKDMGSNDID